MKGKEPMTMSHYHERPNAQSQHVSRRWKASRLLFLLVLGGASLLAVPASAVNLVLNGNFESTSGGSSGQIGNAGFSVTDWTATYLSGSLGQPFAMVGPMSQFSENGAGVSNAFGGPYKLWGNDLPASPAGGNALVSVADWFLVQTRISQTISGLTAGNEYVLSFNFAAGQQEGYDGGTSTRWDVDFGSESFSTDFDNVPSHGFSGWSSVTHSFTASSSSQELSFIAYSPSTLFRAAALLDNVVLAEPSAVPEIDPASFGSALALVLGSLGMLERKARRLVRRTTVA
jgi:hypothetical protein